MVERLHSCLITLSYDTHLFHATPERAFAYVKLLRLSWEMQGAGATLWPRPVGESTFFQWLKNFLEPMAFGVFPALRLSMTPRFMPQAVP